MRLPTINPTKCRKCKPVFFKHEDGWDVYSEKDCYSLQDGSLHPRWYDNCIVEDAPTKRNAIEQLATLHTFGMCIAV